MMRRPPAAASRSLTMLQRAATTNLPRVALRSATTSLPRVAGLRTVRPTMLRTTLHSLGSARLGSSLSGKSPQHLADHSWRQQNHIWTEDEIHERMLTADSKHVPQSFSEMVMQRLVRVAYHSFNALTGYNHEDPPTSAIGYRLIILESVAGVLGGMFRHFRSLRQLERDHGFIFTLLEEAENE